MVLDEGPQPFRRVLDVRRQPVQCVAQCAYDPLVRTLARFVIICWHVYRDVCSTPIVASVPETCPPDR